MKIKWKQLIICLAIPLVTGGLSALLTGGNMEIYHQLNKPALAPPGWLFPVVWTVLYVLMGVASYLVLTSEKPRAYIRRALGVYGLQLVMNFFWTILFFNLRLYLLSFVWLVILWILILETLVLFLGASRPAGYLIAPYLLWVAFAGYLNLFIFLMN